MQQNKFLTLRDLAKQFSLFHVKRSVRRMNFAHTQSNAASDMKQINENYAFYKKSFTVSRETITVFLQRYALNTRYPSRSLRN